MKYVLLIVWLILTVGFYRSIVGIVEQDNLVMSDPVDFRATINKLDIDSLKGKRGKSIDSYFVHYDYVVDEKEYTGLRSVTKEVFDSLQLGEQLDDMIYYRKDPSQHGEKLDYEIAAIPNLAEIVTFIVSLILGIIMFVLYRIFFKSKKSEI